jgi:predicted DNA-binding transcriptional regulator AlpA
MNTTAEITQKDAPARPRLLSGKACAKALGLSYSTFWRMLQRPNCPGGYSCTEGGYRFFDLDEILAFMRRPSPKAQDH